MPAGPSENFFHLQFNYIPGKKAIRRFKSYILWTQLIENQDELAWRPHGPHGPHGSAQTVVLYNDYY